MHWCDTFSRWISIEKQAGARRIIDSLIGQELELIDDVLFEQIRFNDREFGSHIFGCKGGGVAGPLFDYRVRRSGTVEFRYGDRELMFCWDHLQLSGNELIVKCGDHHATCKYFYRPVKRFAIRIKAAHKIG